MTVNHHMQCINFLLFIFYGDLDPDKVTLHYPLVIRRV